MKTLKKNIFSLHNSTYAEKQSLHVLHGKTNVFNGH